MKENTNIELVENEEIEETTEKKNVLAKVGTGIKKHWKKAAALVLVGGVGFILGKSTFKNGDSDDSDVEIIETDDYFVEEVTE